MEYELEIPATISGAAALDITGGSNGLLLTGNNTFTGDFYAQASTVGIGSATALGSGQISLDGSTIRSENGQWTVSNAVTVDANTTFQGGDDLTLSGPISFTGSRGFTVSDFDTITVTNTVGEALVANDSFFKSGIGIFQVQGAWDLGSTFSCYNQGGVILVDGANGAIVDTSGINTYWGGTIQFDNSVVNNNNRIHDEAFVMLDGGAFVINGNASTPTNEVIGQVQELPGALNNNSGGNFVSDGTFVMDSEGGSANPLTVTSPSLVVLSSVASVAPPPGTNETINFVGEAAILGSAGNQLKFTVAAPALNIPGNSGAGILTNAFITTWLPTVQIIGSNTSAAMTSIDFATYIAASGIAVATETDNVNTAGGNVKISALDSNANSVLSSAGQTINALMLVGGAAITAASGTPTLAVSSGLVVASHDGISAQFQWDRVLDAVDHRRQSGPGRPGHPAGGHRRHRTGRPERQLGQRERQHRHRDRARHVHRGRTGGHRRLHADHL